MLISIWNIIDLFNVDFRSTSQIEKEAFILNLQCSAWTGTAYYDCIEMEVTTGIAIFKGKHFNKDIKKVNHNYIYIITWAKQTAPISVSTKRGQKCLLFLKLQNNLPSLTFLPNYIHFRF